MRASMDPSVSYCPMSHYWRLAAPLPVLLITAPPAMHLIYNFVKFIVYTAGAPACPAALLLLLWILKHQGGTLVVVFPRAHAPSSIFLVGTSTSHLARRWFIASGSRSVQRSGDGPELQIRCAPGARATCTAVLFGVLDHCRRPVKSAGVLGGSSWQKEFMR
jgi:hypothetical protein